jgi:hypothetical protein
MNIQIVSPTGEVIATKQGLKLEAVIPPHTVFPRWQLRRRHYRKVLIRDLEQLLTTLRDETRKV